MTAARKVQADAAFPIPELSLEQHIAVLGKTGSGKTSTAKLIVEHVVAEGYRVCVLDPIKSDWWGMISSADGKRPGLPFTVLGGPHGHAPLPAKSGKVLAELVASGKLPLSILDMADFRPGQHQAFFIEFAETLMRRIKGVLYLVMEEAHFLAPKEQAGVGQENLSVYWAKMLATAGRSKGIRLIVLTQRTQALHNALLGSCDTMIVHRMTAPADQKPVVDWLKANVAEVEVRKRISEGMSAIKTGAGYLCAGEAAVFGFVEWPRIKTFDNSATPTKGGAAERQVKTATVDLDALKALIGSAVEEAAANDPAKLKSELARLERELAAAKKHPAAAPPAPAKGPSEAEIEKARQLAFRDGAASRDADVTEAWNAGADAMLARLQEGATAARARLAPPAKARPAIAPPRNVTPTVGAKTPVPVQRPAPVARPAPTPRPANDAGAAVTGPQAVVLKALAWWAAMGHSVVSRAQVAAMCGWSVKSGHLKNVASSLRTAGLVDYPREGFLAMTGAGADAAPALDMSQSFRASLRATLNGPQRQVFDALLEAGGTATRQEIVEALGWSGGSGHIKNVASSLRTLTVIDYPSDGVLELTEWAMAE